MSNEWLEVNLFIGFYQDYISYNKIFWQKNMVGWKYNRYNCWIEESLVKEDG